jgi:O-antigen/teichoic acid export membrane protein
MKASQSIAQRSIMSVSWNVVASPANVVIGFVRSVLLARLLPVEVFGVYGWAGSVVALSAVAANFGLGGAFVHRAPETEDEEQGAAVHFTLQLIFSLVWAILLTAGTLIFASGQTRTALLVLTATSVGTHLVQTPRLILARRVVHRRLALVQVINILLSTLAAVGLAWRGVTLWALLSTDLSIFVINILFFYVWRPVWRPRLTWAPRAMRYFLRFGSRNFMAIALLRGLDRVDDLWTGAYLGKTSMGFYSRAYTFATYPSRLVAAPINMVTQGTYAELKGDRLRLSRAFFRANAFLVRSGFLLAGLLALTAPEFIRLVLSAKWLPMLDAFRLMLVFTLLDPIKLTVGDLFVAVGKPEKVVQARLVQLMVLLAGLFSLGPWLGIAGVALAVDLMVVVGIAILLYQARVYVDFSFTRLFIAPGVALVIGMVLARGAMVLPGILGSDWRTGFVKAVVFSAVYGTVVLVLERQQLFEAFHLFSHHWAQSIGRKAG